MISANTVMFPKREFCTFVPIKGPRFKKPLKTGNYDYCRLRKNYSNAMYCFFLNNDKNIIITITKATKKQVSKKDA